MQCQSCGSELRKEIKQCLTCGEDVTTSFTTTIAQQAARTGLVNYAFVISDAAAVDRSSAALTAKPSENGLSSGGLNPLTTAAASVDAAAGKSTDTPSSPQVIYDPSPPTDVVRIAATRCRRCQHELKVGAKFCSICGTSVAPSRLAKAMKMAQAAWEKNAATIKDQLKDNKLPWAMVLPLALAAIFVLAAFLQHWISLGIDANTSSPLIYHLRSIEFLVLALICVTVGLLLKRR